MSSVVGVRTISSEAGSEPRFPTKFFPVMVICSPPILIEERKIKKKER
jgi:hypothetical protein